MTRTKKKASGSRGSRKPRRKKAVAPSPELLTADAWLASKALKTLLAPDPRALTPLPDDLRQPKGITYKSMLTPTLLELDKARRMTLILCGRAKKLNLTVDVELLSDAASDIEEAIRTLEWATDRPYATESTPSATE